MGILLHFYLLLLIRDDDGSSDMNFEDDCVNWLENSVEEKWFEMSPVDSAAIQNQRKGEGIIL